MKIPKLSELTLKEQDTLFSVLRVAITHHSSKIEGSQLTYGETEALLEKGITANNKPLNEQLEIRGFARCYDEIIRSSFAKRKIDENYIKDLHAMMFENALMECPEFVEKPVGAFRVAQRWIKGCDVKLAQPYDIKNLLGNLLYQKEPETIREIADFHRKFERIHPFSNGNGRIGRLLMAMQFIKNDMIPPLIKNSSRNEYLDNFADLDEMTNFLKKSQEISYSILDKTQDLDKLLEKIDTTTEQQQKLHIRRK